MTIRLPVTDKIVIKGICKDHDDDDDDDDFSL